MALKTVYVELLAETKGLNAGLKKADRKVSAFTTAVKRMGGALAVAFSSRALIRGFAQTIRSTDALIKTAKGVGFTAGQYERLTFALSQVGVEAGSAKIAIGDFQKRLSKAVGGNKSFAKAFKEAGLDIRALAAMSPAAAFDAAFRGLAGQLDDPRIAGLFGNVFEEQSGKDMLKAARQMDKLLEAQKDYDRVVGRGVTRDQARSVEQLTRETKLLSLAWEQAKRDIAIEAVPQIATALQKLNRIGILPAAARHLAALVNGLDEFHQALKLVILDFEKLTGGPMSGTPSFAVDRNGQPLAAPIDSGASPLGLFGKSIKPGLSERSARIEAGRRTQEPGLLPRVVVEQNFYGVTSKSVLGDARRGAAAGAREVVAD